ncbi:MAG TPA: Sec-independent protein translocase protein TatB [Allosphingosinicella sp.]|jgi:sec-independent protein translocase protein TatB
MFGIDSAELLIVAIVALVVIGPRDLPRVMRSVGHWVGKARGMARHFRTGMDTMIREAELDEMQKKWAADNDRIMREHPMPSADPAPPPPAPPGSGFGAPASALTPEASRDRPPPPAPPRRAASPPRRSSAPPPPKRDLP